MTPEDGPDDNQKDGGIDAAEEERMIRIMQYCDGTLSPREAALVADEIARDPGAAQLAAEFSVGAEAARAAWANLESGPVPFQLARQVTQTARKPVKREFDTNWRMAASFVLGIALGALGLLSMRHDSGDGLRLAGSDSTEVVSGQVSSDRSWEPALMAALAKDPETARVSFGGASGTEKAVSVARWFDTATGLHCAEFAKTSAGAPASGGIACKKPDGGWDVIEQQK